MIYLYKGGNLALSTAPTTAQALGALPDALSCTVQRDIEGMFELNMTYPISGANADNIAVNNWIYAPVGGTMGAQYFRIDALEQNIDGTLDIHAGHLTYNSNTILALPFTVGGSYGTTIDYLSWHEALLTAIQGVAAGQMGSLYIIGYTDDMALNPANYTKPVTLKKAVHDAIDGLDIILLYENFGFKLWQRERADTAPSFVIRYGSNMLDYTDAIDATDFYTHIFPFYVVDGVFCSQNNQIFALEGLPSEYISYLRIKALDLNEVYSGITEPLDLAISQNMIDRWLAKNPWQDIPNEIQADALQMEGNTFELGLSGDIYSPRGTVTRADIVSLEYDVLSERITKIGINKRQKDITDTITGLVKRR